MDLRFEVCFRHICHIRGGFELCTRERQPFHRTHTRERRRGRAPRGGEAFDHLILVEEGRGRLRLTVSACLFQHLSVPALVCAGTCLTVGARGGQLIDEEARKLVAGAYERTRALLVEQREQLNLIAETLLKQEMLVHDDMVRGPPQPGRDETGEDQGGG
mmetsp:Transcript_52508/g.137573  ORF Transcript_52508/g.137573 Transcript_52508/m.137573 type:complete len:160 (-) Transcript_52508:387-866(-)